MSDVHAPELATGSWHWDDTLKAWRSYQDLPGGRGRHAIIREIGVHIDVEGGGSPDSRQIPKQMLLQLRRALDSRHAPDGHVRMFYPVGVADEKRSQLIRQVVDTIDAGQPIVLIPVDRSGK